MHAALHRRPTPVLARRVDLAVAKLFVPRRRVFSPIALGPLEEFVLSRIDGRRTIEDLAVLVGLTARELVHVVLRFEEMRIVEVTQTSGRHEALSADDLIEDD